jgi:hypothetical protein
MPEEIIKSPEHAKNLLDNLDAQPKFTKEHLHSIIDGLIQHDNAGKLYSHPGLKSINNLLNHPNVNATHIKKLLGHELFSDHRVLRDAIEEHPRTPPSFK